MCSFRRRFALVLFTPAGLLVLPSARQTLANRARSVLDGLMVGGYGFDQCYLGNEDP